MLSESNRESNINKLSSISMMWVTDSKLFWYMVLTSSGTGVVHTLSYLLFSMAPDLLCCRGKGEHRHAAQFTLKSNSGTGRQFVRSLSYIFVSLHLIYVEKVPGKKFEPCILIFFLVIKITILFVNSLVVIFFHNLQLSK